MHMLSINLITTMDFDKIYLMEHNVRWKCKGRFDVKWPEMDSCPER